MASRKEHFQQDRKDITRRIDVSLEYMARHYPGPHSSDDIAEFCGCGRASIELIFQNALNKMKKRMLEEL